MTDTPYPHCPEGEDFSGLTPTGRKKTSEPELQNFPTKPNADFPAFGLKMKENLVEHAITLNFAEVEAWASSYICKRLAMPKGLLMVGAPTSYTATLAHYVAREMHMAEAAHLQIYDEAPVTFAQLHDFGCSDVSVYIKDVVEMGRDGRPLPKYRQNVRNKVNSNRNKKRKKR